MSVEDDDVAENESDHNGTADQRYYVGTQHLDPHGQIRENVGRNMIGSYVPSIVGNPHQQQQQQLHRQSDRIPSSLQQQQQQQLQLQQMLRFNPPASTSDFSNQQQDRGSEEMHPSQLASHLATATNPLVQRPGNPNNPMNFASSRGWALPSGMAPSTASVIDNLRIQQLMQLMQSNPNNNPESMAAAAVAALRNSFIPPSASSMAAMNTDRTTTQMNPQEHPRMVGNNIGTLNEILRQLLQDSNKDGIVLPPTSDGEVLVPPSTAESGGFHHQHHQHLRRRNTSMGHAYDQERLLSVLGGNTMVTNLGNEHGNVMQPYGGLLHATDRARAGAEQSAASPILLSPIQQSLSAYGSMGGDAPGITALLNLILTDSAPFSGTAMTGNLNSGTIRRREQNLLDLLSLTLQMQQQPQQQQHPQQQQQQQPQQQQQQQQPQQQQHQLNLLQIYTTLLQQQQQLDSDRVLSAISSSPGGPAGSFPPQRTDTSLFRTADTDTTISTGNEGTSIHNRLRGGRSWLPDGMGKKRNHRAVRPPSSLNDSEQPVSTDDGDDDRKPAASPSTAAAAATASLSSTNRIYRKAVPRGKETECCDDDDDDDVSSSSSTAVVASASTGRATTTASPLLSSLPSPSPVSFPVVLYNEQDRGRLGPYQSLLRQQMELFEADEQDVIYGAFRQSRRIPIQYGQVGLRCVHCARSVPLAKRTRGADYYSQTIRNVYQVAQNMAKIHFAQHCRSIPSETRIQLEQLRQCGHRAHGGRTYWSDQIRELGVYEVGSVLRVRGRSSTPSNPSARSSHPPLENNQQHPPPEHNMRPPKKGRTAAKGGPGYDKDTVGTTTK